MSRKEKLLSHVAMVAKFLDDIQTENVTQKWTRTVPTSSILSNFIIQFRDVTLLLNLIKMPVFDLDDEKLMLFYSRRFIRYQNSRNIWINFGLFACPDISNPEFKVNTSKSNECSGIKWCV